MKTTVVVCPFANFGSPGSAHGPESLADAIREMLDDVKKEKRPTRGRAFRDQVNIEEMKFDAPASIADWRQSSQRVAKRVLDRGDFLIWLGGNHLNVLPVYEELGSRDVSVLQFDAHIDIYNLDANKKELNHGNWVRHIEKLPEIVNVGHRDLFLTPKSIHEFFETAYSTADIARDPAGIIGALREWAIEAERLFIDFDCDVIDPAFFPAVTHPMPFGVSSQMVLRLLDAAWSQRTCGIAITEFDPGRDRDERSLQWLVWLIEWVLLKRHE